MKKLIEIDLDNKIGGIPGDMIGVWCGGGRYVHILYVVKENSNNMLYCQLCVEEDDGAVRHVKTYPLGCLVC